MLNHKIDGESLNFLEEVTDNINESNIGSITTTDSTDDCFYDNSTMDGSCWHYWRDHYYPQIIKESYPVFVQDRAEDKGKRAFEIIKKMMDKKLLKMDTVKDFVDAMDLLIKIL